MHLFVSDTKLPNNPQGFLSTGIELTRLPNRHPRSYRQRHQVLTGTDGAALLLATSTMETLLLLEESPKGCFGGF